MEGTYSEYEGKVVLVQGDFNNYIRRRLTLIHSLPQEVNACYALRACRLRRFQVVSASWK